MNVLCGENKVIFMNADCVLAYKWEPKNKSAELYDTTKINHQYYFYISLLFKRLIDKDLDFADI